MGIRRKELFSMRIDSLNLLELKPRGSKEDPCNAGREERTIGREIDDNDKEMVQQYTMCKM